MTPESFWIVALLVIVIALALPAVMLGFSRMPKMDERDSDFAQRDQPLLGWPPTPEDREQAKRLGRVLIMWGVVFVLLLLALLLSVGYIQFPRSMSQ